MRPVVYLAGPDVFYPDSAQCGEMKKALCAEYGLDSIYPADGDLTDSREIYLANCRSVRAADACIANLTPFRGPNVDDGTAFEVGAFRALGKPVFGYTPHLDREYKDHPGANDGHTFFENFGLTCNLMLYWGCNRVFLDFEEAVSALALEIAWNRA